LVNDLILPLRAGFADFTQCSVDRLVILIAAPALGG
jgi:hypothetical protein